MDLEWREGKVPVSIQYQDPYFSFYDGLAESRHVFLNGNGLPGRFEDGFHIAELGFGTGLNLLTALQAWRDAGHSGLLHFTSFEAHPMSGADMLHALKNFPELSQLVGELAPQLGQPEIVAENLRFQLIQGDARQTLPKWCGKADAWFLDGFAPAKNPELWGVELMTQVGKHTAPKGTCSTYTAARAVRQGLTDAGFEITRIKGFGRKRHMIQGRMP